MGIVRDLYYARKMSAGLKLPAPTVALLIKRLRLAAAMGGGIEKTVSGTMVHITDALAKAALSVLASIEPIQDLHGYSSPWPAGGGKNKCVPDLANGQIGSNGGFSSNTSRLTNAVHVDNAYVSNTYLSAGTYTLSVDGLTQCTVLTKDANANIIDNFATAWHNLPYTFTMTAAGYVFFTVRKSSGDLNPDDYKAQIESGSTATSWEPYENICPITGRTGVSVYRTGKNLLNPATMAQGYIESSGNVHAQGDAKEYYSTEYYEVGSQTAISVGYNAFTASEAKWIAINWYDANKTNLSRANKNESISTFTPRSDAVYFRVSMRTYDHGVENCYCALGADTTYESYNGTTYAIDWTSEAGTVYGGTLDVVTGVLTVDRAQISSYAGETLPGAWISDRDAYAAGTTPTTGAQVVYELATPLTYQLSSQEVQMLLGENYVWSSSGDTVSVTYYAEGNANPLQSLNILLGGNYSNPKTADDVSDKEALEIILGGNK